MSLKETTKAKKTPLKAKKAIEVIEDVPKTPPRVIKAIETPNAP